MPIKQNDNTGFVFHWHPSCPLNKEVMGSTHIYIVIEPIGLPFVVVIYPPFVVIVDSYEQS